MKQIEFGDDGSLEHFWAEFQQICDGDLLLGEIRSDADVPLLLHAPSLQTALNGRQLSFEVTGVDAQGQPAALEATGLPAGASFSDAGDGTGQFTWTPAAGQTGPYLVAFHGESLGGEEDSVYTHLDAIPDFDDFDHPLAFTTLPFESLVDVPEVSRAADDPLCTPGGAPFFTDPGEGTMWYVFTPEEDSGVQVRVRSPFPSGGAAGATPSPRPPRPLAPPRPARLSVYTGVRGALEPVSCFPANAARFAALAGTDYYVMVEDDPSSQFQLSAEWLPPPPRNDGIGDATIVGALPYSETSDTRGAMFQQEPSQCAWILPPGIGVGAGGIGVIFGSSGPPTNVWYTYTATEDTWIAIDTSRSKYQASITAFSGPGHALLPLGCASRQLGFLARSGQTYHIMIAGSLNPLGDQLQVSFAAAALRMQAALDAVGVVNPRTGTTVIHGTATCSQAMRLNFQGMLQQGHRGVWGLFTTAVDCDGATTWSATVIPAPTGRSRFKVGPTQAAFQVTGFAYEGDQEAVAANGRATIVLKAASSR